MWDDSYSGSWTDSDYSPSSNMRELKAIRKVIMDQRDQEQTTADLIGQHDSSCKRCKGRGEQQYRIHSAIERTIQADKELGCTIAMRHIPGKNNIFADAASRRNFKDEYD